MHAPADSIAEPEILANLASFTATCGPRRRPRREDAATVGRHRPKWLSTRAGRRKPSGLEQVAHGPGSKTFHCNAPTAATPAAVWTVTRIAFVDTGSCVVTLY